MAADANSNADDGNIHLMRPSPSNGTDALRVPLPRRRLLAMLASAAAGPALFAACSGDSDDSSALTLDNPAEDDGLRLSPVEDEAPAPAVESTDAAAETAAPAASDTAALASTVGFTYSDGAAGSLADFTGKPTVVNFFASWCPPCREEMPDFEAAWQTHRDQVNFIGIATNDEGGAAAELVAETGVSYPWGIDPQQDLYFSLGGIAMPTTIFLNADGSAADSWFGILLAEELETKIQAIL